ncbi:MAG: alpha/beta hydrolase, partial [Acidimicrobiia bacterium]|nr:alpha/beta hydrolase [Acidimicrobiia bacterium]
EVTGAGPPILFMHEFAGDHRSWEPQVRHLSRWFTCITYAARGYTPSDVPTDPAAYSQQHAIADAVAVLDGLSVEQAHVAGLSMGGFCALHLARQHPERVLSAAIGGVGYGAAPERRAAFERECEAIARAFEKEGSRQVAARYALGPARVQLQAKDPRGHAEFTEMLAEHSHLGSALTMRGFQKSRPSLYDFVDEFAEMTTPVLVMVGDEDDGAIEASLMLKRTIPTAGLLVLPKTGHTLNLEEPELFNRMLTGFFAAVVAGSWGPRDPRSLTTSTTGMDDHPGGTA